MSWVRRFFFHLTEEWSPEDAAFMVKLTVMIFIINTITGWLP